MELIKPVRLSTSANSASVSFSNTSFERYVPCLRIYFLFQAFTDFQNLAFIVVKYHDFNNK